MVEFAFKGDLDKLAQKFNIEGAKKAMAEIKIKCKEQGQDFHPQVAAFFHAANKQLDLHKWGLFRNGR